MADSLSAEAFLVEGYPTGMDNLVTVTEGLLALFHCLAFA
jgi:hypothetical protein